MRNLIRNIADALLSVAFGVFMITLHFSLLSVCKANLQRTLTVPNYRPIYSRSGRRKRIRC